MTLLASGVLQLPSLQPPCLSYHLAIETLTKLCNNCLFTHLYHMTMNLLKAQCVLFTIVSTILSIIPATEEVLTKCVVE